MKNNQQNSVQNSVNEDEASMSISGHLNEMRNRIIICVAVLAVGFGVMLFFSPSIVTLLTNMGVKYGYVFVNIAPQETLMVELSIALLGSVIIAFPVLAYEIYAFCSPGLTKRERIFTSVSLLSGALCFCIGVLFAYLISVPFMLNFLIKFGTDLNIESSISIEKYVNFLLTVFMIFGIVFELPVVSTLLTGLGIIKPEWLEKSQKVMIVVIFVVAALITPPDIVSQIMVAVPMIGLYQLSIILSKICYKFKKEEANKETD